MTVSVCVLLSFFMPTWPVTFWANVSVGSISVILYVAVRKGFARSVGVLALFLISLSVAVDSFNPNRTFGLAAPAIPLLIVFAAFVYGRTSMLLTIALNIVWIVIVTALKLSVYPVASRLNSMQIIDAVAYVLYFIATGLVMVAAEQYMARAQSQIDTAAQTLAQRNALLEQEVKLRKRAGDRADDARKRALQAAGSDHIAQLDDRIADAAFPDFDKAGRRGRV